MFTRQITLFELLGFKVKVDFTWIFLALLVTWSLAEGFFPGFYPGLSASEYWWMGVAGMIGLVFSLVLHELSHSLVARRYGIPITGITLFIFGGVAEMEEEPPSPKSEFWMAIAGPIMSFALAITFHFVQLFAEQAGLPAAVTGIAFYLKTVNGLLAIFNLVPGFPLDGGRVFRSILWHWKGDLRWATRVASNVGSGFGLVLIALGLLNALRGDLVGGVWWFILGLFLRTAAAGSYQQLVLRRSLEGEEVRRFMTAGPVTVAPEITLDRLVEDYIYHHHFDLFPVVEGTRLLGLVSARMVKNVPREQWPAVRVGDIMVDAGSGNTIEAGADAVRALSRMQRGSASRLLVVEGGRLVGILSLKDMLELLALKLDLEGMD